MQMAILPLADDITYVVLTGRLDSTGAEEIDENFSQATAARERPAIIDLAQIDFMASRGIGVLLANCKKLRSAGHRLVLLNPQKLVESALRTSRLDTLMPITFDLEEAIRIVQGFQVSPGAARPVEAAVGESRVPREEPERAVPAALEGELKLVIKNELSELKDVTAAMSQFLDAHRVPHRAAYAVNLAVDELVTNVMRYAYVDDETHLINLDFAIRGDQIILQIVDDGRPFDPRTGPTLDLHAEERQVGGLGLILVLDMVDVLKYERTGERNCLEARIQLYAENKPNEQRGEPNASGKHGSG
jgi:anti-anti-sigma factor